MRFWRVELRGADGLRANAFVLAPDAKDAREVAAADPDDHWNDGLFHRSADASLVAEADALSALRPVIEADPFDGQPPYGVRFAPAKPIVLWTELNRVDAAA